MKTFTLSTRSRAIWGSIALTIAGFAQTVLAQEALNSPQATAQQYARLFNVGDIDGLMKLFAADSVFVPAPGSPLNTPQGIRGATQQFLAAKVPMQLTVRHVYQTTDTALVVVDWSMKGKTPDGKTMDLAGSGTDVLRKGADGTWRYIIDNPFGSARPAQ